MSESRWPTVPEPGLDPNSIYMSVMSLKQSMELLTGQRGFDSSYSFDQQVEILTKTANGISATVASNKQVAANANGAVAMRTNLVEAEILAARAGESNLNARVVSVETASVSRDGALASSISIVTARVNDVSAGGFFKTQASVSGVSLASMEAQVYTSNAFTGVVSAGWRVRVSGGVGYFEIYTGQFRLLDNTNTPKEVMYYDGGQFRFTGNIALDGNLVVNGTVASPSLATAAVTNPKIAANAVTSAGFAITTAYECNVTVYAREGSVVLITAQLDAVSITGSGAGVATASLYCNGSFLREIKSPRIGSFADPGSGESGPGGYAVWVPGVTAVYVFTVPSEGFYTFALRDYESTFNTPKYMWATELSK